MEVFLVLWTVVNLLWTTILWIAWLKEDDEMEKYEWD